jgi:uncharacterized protein (TIGR02996 family)
MSDRDALHAALIAHPDDDTVRLVYADWLQENGEGERAEFIRVQCRLEQVSRRSAEGKRLVQRESELRAKLFGHLDALGFRSVTWRRGFVGTVKSGACYFRDHAAVLTADRAPAFELTLSDRSDDTRDWDVWVASPENYAFTVDEAMRHPALRRCVALNLPNLGVLPTEKLLASPQLTNLRRLNFPGNKAGPALHALAGPMFANLRWLNVSASDSANGVADFDKLIGSPHLQRLEHLDFSANRFHGDDLQSLSEYRGALRLRHLSLARSEFSPFDVSYFLFWNRTRNLPALTELDLSGSCDDLTDLSASVHEPDEHERHLRPFFGRLSKLWLRNNGITDKGARVLSGYAGPAKIELLDLRGNQIGAWGKRALRKRFGKDVCVF